MVQPGEPLVVISVTGKNKEDMMTYAFPVKDEETGEVDIHHPISESRIKPLLAENIGDGFGILCFDDVTGADPSVQNALYDLSQFHRIGGHKLGKNVLIMMTGNMSHDGSYAVPWNTALLGRSWAIQFKPSLDTWLKRPENKRADPYIVGFLKAYPDWFAPDMSGPDSNKYFDDMNRGPQPRQWTDFALTLTNQYGGIDNFKGNICFKTPWDLSQSFQGPKPSQALETFVKQMSHYKTAEELFENPLSWQDIPAHLRNKPAEVYAVAHSVRLHAVMQLEKIVDEFGDKETKQGLAARDKLVNKFCHVVAQIMNGNREMGAFCFKYFLKETLKDPVGGIFCSYVHAHGTTDPVLKDAKIDQVLEDIKAVSQAHLIGSSAPAM
jgi:hypothetical protein